jgi:hypothetical protein
VVVRVRMSEKRGPKGLRKAAIREPQRQSHGL